jgi:hypothetical protein
VINYSGYLHKKFPLYIISGIILAAVVFASVLIDRYDRYLYSVLDDMQTILLNKERVHEQVKEIDLMLDYFRTRYRINISDISPERQVLSTLDRIKSHMPDAQISVTSFEKNKGNLQLPVNIQLPVSSYNGLVNAVGFIEALGVPDFKIERLYISEGQTSGLVLMITGALSMPLS